MGVKVVTKIDKTKDILANFKSLSKIDVLVGVPAENAFNREADDKVNNAELIAYHTKGVRRKSMIEEMNKNIEQGKSYAEAYAMYIASKGSPLWRIPPRPIIEPAIEATDNAEKIAARLKVAGQYMLDGNKEDMMKSLHSAGLEAVNIIKAWFHDPRNNWPPLSDYTIKHKGSEAILIDTAKMRDAITYVIPVEGERND